MSFCHALHGFHAMHPLHRWMDGFYEPRIKAITGSKNIILRSTMSFIIQHRNLSRVFVISHFKWNTGGHFEKSIEILVYVDWNHTKNSTTNSIFAQSTKTVVWTNPMTTHQTLWSQHYSFHSGGTDFIYSGCLGRFRKTYQRLPKSISVTQD